MQPPNCKKILLKSKEMSKRQNIKIALYGYGNPEKQDAGLGVQCARKLEKWIREEEPDLNVDIECRTQLEISDVERIAGKDIVIFVDSSKENISDFYLSKVVPANHGEEAVPERLIYLCKKRFNKTPMAFKLHIRGYKWRDCSQLSEKAAQNVMKAIQFLKEKLKKPDVFIHAYEDKCSIDIV